MKNILPLLLIVIACSAPKEEIKKVKVGQIITPAGEMLFYFHDATPNHRSSFMELAKASYWDTLTFNRVIDGFVIQGGCPDTPEGFSDSPYLIAPEFNDSIKHIYGAVGAGRDNNPNKLSAGCQFYIVHDKEGIARLDNNYVIFGQVFKGLDILEKLGQVETDSLDAPTESIPLQVKVIEIDASEIERSNSNSGS